MTSDQNAHARPRPRSRGHPLIERRTIALSAIWLAAVLAIHAVAALPVGHRMGGYLAAHALAFAAALALHALAAPRAVAALVFLGVGAQLALAPAPPITSTDSARYLWDGAVVLAGHDPYVLRPDDAALDGVADVFGRPTDHLDVPTCYPPVALALFSLAARTGPRAAPGALALLLALASALCTLSVHQALKRRGRERDALLLALSPLVMFEVGVGAHLDILVALALVSAALATGPGRGFGVGLFIGLAAALKIWPIALVLVVLRHVSLRRFVAGLALGLSPFAIATALFGHLPLGSLGLMAETWSFGSPIWWICSAMFDEEPPIRLALALATVAGCVWIGWRARRPVPALLGGSLIILALSPTLYPWYAVPLVPLAALTRWLRRPVLALSLVLPASYEVVDGYQRTADWAPATWPTLLTLTAVLGALMLEVWQPRPRAREQASPA